MKPVRASWQIAIGLLITLVGGLTLYSPGGWEWLSALNIFFGGILIGMGYVLRILER